jgi:integrase
MKNSGALAAEDRRALELDTLAAILPIDRRDALSVLLTDDDVATLKHLANEGIGDNSLRALTSDLAYLEAWSLAATGGPLPWPAPEALALKFVAHHLWDPQKRETDAAHGMPGEVDAVLRAKGHLRSEGPHAPGTVKRRLAHWGTLHRWRGLDGPFAAPTLRAALRLAVRASARPRGRKSQKAVTRDVLEQLLAVCDWNRLVDCRDKALLLTAFASGGRRRSEIARLRLDQIFREAPAPLDPADPLSETLPCLSIVLGRTKTGLADEDTRVLLIGPPVAALEAWIAEGGLTKGPVFRAIDRWGTLRDKELTPQAVNLIVKARCAKAGLDPYAFSAHGLRSGFLTEAARRGVPLPEAMRQSQHRSAPQALRYYNDAEARLGAAARLLV